jgi:PAS domain-containing protein
MEKKNAYEAISLRQKAEVRFKEKHSKKAATLTESETLKLLYELELHQIELEIQNDELRLAVHKAETANTLYDFSPAGYFTLDRDGAIFQLNLNGTKLLGLDRSFLVNSNIRTSISPDTLPVFIDFLKNVFKTNSKETCEVRLVTNGNPSHFVHLEGCLTPDEQKCLVTAVDISGQKQVEDQLLYRNILLSSQQEASLDGILVVDENKTIISYNRRFVELMGIPQALIENSADEPVLRFVTDQMVDPQQFIRNAQYLYDHRRETSKEELVL